MPDKQDCTSAFLWPAISHDHTPRSPMDAPGQVSLLIHPRGFNYRLLASPHPLATDLRVQVHVHLVHEHRCLIRRQGPQQRLQGPEFGLTLWVFWAKDGSGPPPHKPSVTEPQPNRLPSDPDLEILSEQDRDCFSAPPASGELKAPGRHSQHPPNHQGCPDMYLGSRSAPFTAKDFCYTASVKPLLPASNRGWRGIQHCLDRCPRMAITQQQKNVSALSDLWVGVAPIGPEQEVAVSRCKPDTRHHQAPVWGLSDQVTNYYGGTVMPRKQHIVKLTPEEREYLTRLISSSSKTSALTQTRAYILLKADAPPTGPGWDDARIAEAFLPSIRTVERIRRRYAERGLAATLARKPQERPSRTPILDARRLQELIRQSPRSFGKKRSTWTLQLLAETCTELGIVEGTVSDETVRRTLKRAGVKWRRTQLWITSPDPDYAQKKARRDRFIRLAGRHPEWVVGFVDEVWWSRIARPSLRAWSAGEPVKLHVLSRPDDDPDPVALCC